MAFPNTPSIVEHTDIFVPDLFQLQGQLGTQGAILPVAISHNQGVFRQIVKDRIRLPVKVANGHIASALDVAFLVKLRRPGIDKNGSTGQELIFCFIERDQDVLAELQCDSCFRRPVAEERYGIGTDLVHDEA